MQEDKKQQLHNTFKLVSAIVKLLILAVIIIGVPLYIWFFHHELITDLSNLRKVETVLLNYKKEGILIYIAAQIVQIIICVIPGQELQFAAGYLYGFFPGLLFSLIGAALGTIASYYIARLLGHDAMHIIFGEEKLNKILEKVRDKKGVMFIFLFYLIPGLPKDLCSYAAGMAGLHPLVFLIVSLCGRTPAMMGSLIIGHLVMHGHYEYAIAIGAGALVLCIIGLIFHNKVLNFFDKSYDRLMKIAEK